MTIKKFEWFTPAVTGGDGGGFRDYFSDFHDALTIKSEWKWERYPGDLGSFDVLLVDSDIGGSVPKYLGFRVYKFADGRDATAPIYARVNYWAQFEGANASGSSYASNRTAKLFPALRMYWGGSISNTGSIDADLMSVSFPSYIGAATTVGSEPSVTSIPPAISYIYTDTDLGHFYINYGVQSRSTYLPVSPTTWKARGSWLNFGFEREYDPNTGAVLNNGTAWFIPASDVGLWSGATSGTSGKIRRYDHTTKAWSLVDDFTLWAYTGKQYISNLSAYTMYQPMTIPSSVQGIVPSRFMLMYRLLTKTPHTREIINVDGIPTTVYHHDMNRGFIVGSSNMNGSAGSENMREDLLNICMCTIERS